MKRCRKRGHKRVLDVLLPLLLAGGSAMAMPPSGALAFDDFDLNRDGVITRQEMDQARRQRMGAAATPMPSQLASGRGMGRGATFVKINVVFSTQLYL